MLQSVVVKLLLVFLALFTIVGIAMLVAMLVLAFLFLWFLWKESRGSESDS